MQSNNSTPSYPTIEDAIGKTPLAALQRIGAKENAARGNIILGKLEGNNPAGSVKDRPALSMIQRAQERGEIKPGDTLIEATSGNTGIALAMAAAIKGYRMVLIMPEDLSIERAQTMKAFGAELILTPKSGGMEYARDLAETMQKEGRAACSTNSAITTTRVSISKPQALKFGKIRKGVLPTSLARWVPLALSQGSRVI